MLENMDIYPEYAIDIDLDMEFDIVFDMGFRCISLGETMYELFKIPPGANTSSDRSYAQRIDVALNHIKTNKDIPLLELSDTELIIMIQKSQFTEIAEDQAAPQMGSKVPRVISKRGRPPRQDWVESIQEYKFELRLEISVTFAASIVLYALSDIPTSIEFLPYRGLFKLIPSSDSMDTEYIKYVPPVDEYTNFQINTVQSSGLRLVLDSRDMGNYSRFAGAESDRFPANAKLTTRRKSCSTDIECCLKSIRPIRTGDRITLANLPETMHTHVVSCKGKQAVLGSVIESS